MDRLSTQTALLQGVKLLEDGAIGVPRLTAEVLLVHALGHECSYLYAHPEEPLSEVAWLHYGRYLHERLKGKPTQYITGRQEFYGREFRVTPDVLIPRPETEHLIEAALARIQAGDVVLDVGAGSGAIGITLALETAAQIYATDISIAALHVAGENDRRLSANISLVASDLTSAFSDRSFELVPSNPPDVPQTDQPPLQPQLLASPPPLPLSPRPPP